MTGQPGKQKTRRNRVPAAEKLCLFDAKKREWRTNRGPKRGIGNLEAR